jgi:hypothetical protein
MELGQDQPLAVMFLQILGLQFLLQELMLPDKELLFLNLGDIITQMSNNNIIRIKTKEDGEDVELSQTAGVIAFLILLPIVIVIELVGGTIKMIFGD